MLLTMTSSEAHLEFVIIISRYLSSYIDISIK